MSLSKRTRFEVFKRDSFTCQYCGKKAPDVVLHVDHIQPKAGGGSDEIVNLITACEGCNLGKAAVPLSDDSAVSKQHAQLSKLQERQEQIEMMLEWHRSLAGLDRNTIQQAADHWCELAGWFDVTEEGKRNLGRWIKKHGLDAVLEAMRIASETYFRYDGQSHEPTSETAATAWSKIPGICTVRAASKKTPYLPDLYYIRAILRNRAADNSLSYFDEERGMELLKAAFEDGGDADELKHIARTKTTWSSWRNEMCDYIARLRGDE